MQQPSTGAWTQAPVPFMAVGSQLSAVHTMPSSQLGGVPETQSPVWKSQVSRPSQKWPLSQTLATPTQLPSLQASFRVQGLLSVHSVPSGFAGFEHVPFAGSQVPATWHWSAAGQLTGLLPVHIPLSHVSVCVQALWSLHVVPSDLLV